MFLVDGRPDGLRVVEKSNWSGKGLMCSRTQFPSIRHRSEFDRAGVYVLVGDEPTAIATPRIYIGAGFGNRVPSFQRQHVRGVHRETGADRLPTVRYSFSPWG